MKNFFVISILLFCALNVIGQAKDQIKFTAKIANRNSDTLVIQGKDFKKVIPINKQEIFVASFDAPKGFYVFSDGTESSRFYLKPNSDITLTMDAKEFDETIIYKGKGVNESNFMAQQALRNEKLEEAFTKEPVEFATLFESKKKADIESLEKGSFDPEFATAMKSNFVRFNEFASQEYERVAKANKMVGNPSPSFDYVNYAGGKSKLEDFKGKYVYIDVWATWCGPCRQEIPFLKKAEEKYHGKNITFISISIDKLKDQEKWKTMIKEKELGGVQLFADNDWNSKFVQDYKITGIPRFILIDPKGNIVKADAARPSSAELIKELDSLLN
jgi:thiol-disulfide isomerase/thioredoxin